MKIEICVLENCQPLEASFYRRGRTGRQDLWARQRIAQSVTFPFNKKFEEVTRRKDASLEKTKNLGGDATVSS